MSEIIQILKRGNGRTVYINRGRLLVRFDSEEDRQWYEIACRFQECVARQDIKTAADVVFEAVDTGVICDEEDDLLDLVADDDAREIIRLELEAQVKATESSLLARIEELWSEEP